MEDDAHAQAVFEVGGECEACLACTGSRKASLATPASLFNLTQAFPVRRITREQGKCEIIRKRESGDRQRSDWMGHPDRQIPMGNTTNKSSGGWFPAVLLND